MEMHGMKCNWKKIKKAQILFFLALTMAMLTSCYSDANLIIIRPQESINGSQSISISQDTSLSGVSEKNSDPGTETSISSKTSSTISKKTSSAISVADEPSDPKVKANAIKRNQMNLKYGIEIYYGDDTYWEYKDVSMTYLRDSTYISIGLSMLDEELSRYPVGFFMEFNRKLRIFLITSFTENYSGMAVYSDRNYYELYVTASEYSIPTLHHELMHMIDYSLLDKTGVNSFPNWNSYNPSGFYYTNIDNSTTPYLYSEKITAADWYFVSNYSTKNEMEDRAEIFEKLMTTEKAMPYFSGSSPLANKIKYMVSIIKKSFHTIDALVSPTWERYLS